MKTNENNKVTDNIYFTYAFFLLIQLHTAIICIKLINN
jgi:hypothetical protein